MHTDQLIAQRIDELATHLQRAAPQHDVLHAQDCLVASGILAARPRLPSALFVRTVHHVESFDSPYLDACQARSIRSADLCLTVSRQTQRDVQDTFQRPSTVVGNGVELERFRYGHKARDLTVLSIGGIEPRKNSLLMLEAFVRARRQLPGLRWVIVGGASILDHDVYRQEFARRKSALPEDCRGAIQELGVLSQADLVHQLQSAGCLLHASVHEGFGLCILEAMASGAPVVVSRGMPFDEFVSTGCAVRVLPHDADDIARGLVEALTRGASYTQHARRHVQSFGWSHCAARHIDAYRSALGHHASKEPLHA